MDKYLKREFIAKGTIGLVGVILSLFSYFLIERDMEIKKRVSDLESSVQLCERVTYQTSSRLDEAFHAIQRFEGTCCKWKDAGR